MVRFPGRKNEEERYGHDSTAYGRTAGKKVEAAVSLIDEGNTIPFIARYRKEATGSLNDEELRKLYERLQYLRNLEERKTQVKKSIEEQGKLTEELVKAISAASTLVAVEDIYRPYRRRGWSPWPTSFCSRRLDAPCWRRLPPMSRRRKGWPRPRKLWREPGIFWQS